jgi:hypothetical protein
VSTGPNVSLLKDRVLEFAPNTVACCKLPEPRAVESSLADSRDYALAALDKTKYVYMNDFKYSIDNSQLGAKPVRI